MSTNTSKFWLILAILALAITLAQAAPTTTTTEAYSDAKITDENGAPVDLEKAATAKYELEKTTDLDNDEEDDGVFEVEPSEFAKSNDDKTHDDQFDYGNEDKLFVRKPKA